MNTLPPIHFQSGGCCRVKIHEDGHFHAESVNDDGTIDKALPHVYTKEDQNALMWLAFRNQAAFAKVKPREPLILAVPDFDPKIRKELHEKEQNLGTESNLFMLKVYQLMPREEDLNMVKFCGLVNKETDLQSKVDLIHSLINSDKTHYLYPICTKLVAEYAKPGTKKVHIYFFTDRHVKFINQAAQEFFDLVKRVNRGVSNHTTCTRVIHSDFPKMTKELSDKKLKEQLLPLLDDLSSSLPDGVLFIDQPEKSSKSGWRIWSCDQNDTLVAVNYAQTTNHYGSADVINALVIAFNALGIKANKMFNRKIDKSAIQVAFTPEQLLLLNKEEFGYKVNRYLSEKKMK